jgi:pilus assembly protein CpaF
MSIPPAGKPVVAGEPKRDGIDFRSYLDLKIVIHRELVNQIDLEKVATQPDDPTRRQVYAVIQQLVSNLKTPMAGRELIPAEQERLSLDVLDEVFGLGPLEPLFKDPTVSDIMVNAFDNVYIERAGRLIETNVRFKNQAHVRMIIDRIVSNIGRRIDDSSPIVDARLDDGSRVCAVIPPLSLLGPVLSIRRFGRRLLTTAELVKEQMFSPGMLDFLTGCVEARLNIVIAGGTGSGKTTLLNTLSAFYSGRGADRHHRRHGRIAAASRRTWCVSKPGRPTWKAPAPSHPPAGHQRLRMRPDRIIVGESAARRLDMLQAMNTGHDGSMTTTHANTPRDGLGRLEVMVGMANANMGIKSIPAADRVGSGPFCADFAFQRWHAPHHAHYRAPAFPSPSHSCLKGLTNSFSLGRDEITLTVTITITKMSSSVSIPMLAKHCRRQRGKYFPECAPYCPLG